MTNFVEWFTGMLRLTPSPQEARDAREEALKDQKVTHRKTLYFQVNSSGLHSREIVRRNGIEFHPIKLGIAGWGTAPITANGVKVGHHTSNGQVNVVGGDQEILDIVTDAYEDLLAEQRENQERKRRAFELETKENERRDHAAARAALGLDPKTEAQS